MGISVLQNKYNSGDLRLHLSLRDGTFYDSGPWKFVPTTANVPGVKTENGMGRFWDSSGTMIEYADNDLFDFGLNSFSIACWVKGYNPAAYRPFVSHISGTGYALISNQVTGVAYMLVGATNAFGTSNVITGRWNFVVGVRNGNDVLIYVNGLWESTTAGAGAQSGTVADVVRVGRNNASTTAMLGNIDEVCIFSGALSAWEVATLAKETAPRD